MNVLHHGGKIVAIDGVPTRDAAASGFKTRGRYYTEEVSPEEVARRYGTSDCPKANRVTAAQMNKINRAHYKR